jgi:Protein of unknown function (DUF1064)
VGIDRMETPGKYRNKKVKLLIDGKPIVFDSQAEAQRGLALLSLRDKGVITGLEFQPEFILQEGFKLRGKRIRAIKYIADFKYSTKDGGIVVEDTKGKKTKEYLIKRKMFLLKHGQECRLMESVLKRGLFEFEEV